MLTCNISGFWFRPMLGSKPKSPQITRGESTLNFEGPNLKNLQCWNLGTYTHTHQIIVKLIFLVKKKQNLKKNKK